MQKNIASQKWRVFAFDRTTNAPLTGDAANITAKISKDFGAATATNDVNPTEVEDGYYEFDLTPAETNADDLLILPQSATANIVVVGCPARIATTPASWADGVIQTGDSFARIGTNGSGLTSLAPASTALSTATWTATRAGYIDNLSAGAAATAAAQSSMQSDVTTTKNSVTSGGFLALIAGSISNDTQSLVNSTVAASGSVQDASASTTVFETTLTQADGFWDDATITFTSGALDGQTRPILSYSQTNGTITLDEAATSAPANGVTFQINVSHEHPVSQIQAGLATSTNVSDLQTHGDATWSTATGFSTHSAADVATAVWAAGARTLTGFGSLVADIATAVWAAVTRTLTSGDAPSAATIADAVCDELLADHVIAGSVAAGISSAQAAGDPLSSAVPGAYAAGTAGFALGEVASFNPFVINSSTTNIADRVQATTITLYYGENGYTVGPVEVLNDGVAVDLTAFTSLRFTIEDKYKTDLLVTTSVTISGVSDNYWQVTGTSAATLTAPASHQWSLRGIGTNINVVLGHGTVNLVYVPDLDV